MSELLYHLIRSLWKQTSLKEIAAIFSTEYWNITRKTSNKNTIGIEGCRGVNTQNSDKKVPNTTIKDASCFLDYVGLKNGKKISHSNWMIKLIRGEKQHSYTNSRNNTNKFLTNPILVKSHTWKVKYISWKYKENVWSAKLKITLSFSKQSFDPTIDLPIQRCLIAKAFCLIVNHVDENRCLSLCCYQHCPDCFPCPSFVHHSAPLGPLFGNFLFLCPFLVEAIQIEINGPQI